MSVCEVPLLSGLPRLIDIQTSEPTAWRVASDHVSIQTNTRLASSQLNPVFRALSSTGRSWASATDLNLDNARVNRATERFEFASGVDGKIGDSRPSTERANLDARCRFGSTHCYHSTDDFALHILASLPNEVEVARAWPEFVASMSSAVRV